MRIRSNHWINRQRDMVNGVQSCELDLTVPGKIEYTEVRNFAQGEEEWASHRDSATMDVA